ncbi:tetratricopeptide repeat protein [Streptomyces sp. NPDC049881]|uniref:ATP-binding protein n=1 Tax=Streptomyces sp. NPDC049881 TaxID=3155778 RepID=UPI00343AFEE3
MQAGHVSGGIHFHGRDEPVTPYRRPRQLPGDPHAFVNRTDELHLLDALLAADEGDAPPVISLCVVAGTPGAGKTALALRWAHRVKQRFPDGQLYADLRGYDPQEPVSPAEALRGFLLGLGVPATAVPADLETAAALYRSVLADRRVLVLLDNAATVSQVRPLLPGGSATLVLVTSRERLSGLAVRDGARRITLRTLPEEEAIALLRTVTAGHRHGDRAEALAELARLCACLPLALRIAAERAVTHPHTAIGELVADLRDESALWDTLSTGDDAEADAVRTVFAWSYRALPPQAARLFRLLGLHAGPDFDLGAAAALAGTTERRARQTLDVLVGAHLLEQRTPRRYAFHDLLRAYATGLARQEEDAPEHPAALLRLLDWYLHTALAAREVLSPGREPIRHAPVADGVAPLSFTAYDDAVDWAEQEQGNFPPTVRTAERTGAYEHARLLAEALYHAQAPSAPAAAWAPVGAIGLACARRLGDRPGEATLLHLLGFTHRRLHALAEAAACHEGALAIRRAVGDARGEAECLSALGLVRLRHRRFDAAEECFDGAALLFERLGAPQRAAVALVNRAAAHHAAGRVERAAEDLARVLPGFRADGRRALLGDALRVAASIHLDRGEAEDAFRCAAEAVDLALELRDDTLEGYWLLGLGAAQRALGRHADALASYQRSTVLHRRLGDRSREAMAWQGAGEAYAASGDARTAARFCRMAAEAHGGLGDGWHEALALAAWANALDGDDAGQAAVLRRRARACLAEFTDERAALLRARLRSRTG